MKELIGELTPYALAGFYALVGVGGTVGYYKRNGNGKWNGQSERRSEPAVTQRECELIHQGLNTRLDEGNQKMGRMETKLDGCTKEIVEALTLVREHTRNKRANG